MPAWIRYLDPAKHCLHLDAILKIQVGEKIKLIESDFVLRSDLLFLCC